MVFGVWNKRAVKLANVDITDIPTNIARCVDSISLTETSTCINNFLCPVTIRVVNRETI